MANLDAFREKARTQREIGIILCDLGNVLVNWRRHDEFPDFVSRCSAGPEEIRRFVHDGEEYVKYEREKITSEEFFASAKKAIGYLGDYRQFALDYCSIFALKEDVYSFLFSEIKPMFDVEFWMVSNINRLHLDYISARWPGVFSNCKRLFLSCELGCGKPEPEFWQKVLECGPAGEMGLIDDLKDNGESAKKFGIKFIHFTGLENLKREMKSKWYIGE